MSEVKINKLFQNIKMLRHPEKGCPWDIKQNHKTLIKFLIEETYETIYAIENESPAELKDELGDVLLQVLLHSVIAEQSKSFNFQEVIDNLNEKIVRRHPHVFSNVIVKDEKEVKENWKKIKDQESSQSDIEPIKVNKKHLSAPSLKAAHQIGEFTKEKSFDWTNPIDVIDKVQEEIAELKEELKEKVNPVKIEEELGDLLFTVAQLSRHLGLCPEVTLGKANNKFKNRYNKMIEFNSGKDIADLTTEQKERLWEQVKNDPST